MVISRFIDNGDVRIHFLDSGGDDRGAPIVFVPGMTGAGRRVLSPDVARRLLDGRWRGTPVTERLDEGAAIKTFQAATARSFWEEIAGVQPPLLVRRHADRVDEGH